MLIQMKNIRLFNESSVSLLKDKRFLNVTDLKMIYFVWRNMKSIHSKKNQFLNCQ